MNKKGEYSILGIILILVIAGAILSDSLNDFAEKTKVKSDYEVCIEYCEGEYKTNFWENNTNKKELCVSNCGINHKSNK